jgi:hypothetical protein
LTAAGFVSTVSLGRTDGVDSAVKDLEILFQRIREAKQNDLYKTDVYLGDINDLDFGIPTVDVEDKQDILDVNNLHRNGGIFHAILEEEIQADVIYSQPGDGMNLREFAERNWRDLENSVAQWEKWNGDIEMFDDFGRLEDIEDIDVPDNYNVDTVESSVLPGFNPLEWAAERFSSKAQDRIETEKKDVEQDISHLENEVIRNVSDTVENVYNSVFENIEFDSTHQKTGETVDEIQERYKGDHSRFPIILTSKTIGEALKGTWDGTGAYIHLHTPMLSTDGTDTYPHKVLQEALNSSTVHEALHHFPKVRHNSEKSDPISLNRVSRLKDWMTETGVELGEFTTASLQMIDNAEVVEEENGYTVNVPEIDREWADEIFRKNIDAHLEDIYNFAVREWDRNYDRQSGELSLSYELEEKTVIATLSIDSDNYLEPEEIKTRNN